MRQKKLELFLLILVFLINLFFLDIGETYGIYRDTFNTNVYLSILDPNTSYTINFNTHGGSSVSSITRTINQPIGTLPTTSQEGFNFLGWYTEATGGTKVNFDTIVTGSATYHAHWVKIVCKKALAGTLHTETCFKTTDNDNQVGCRSAGYAQNATLTYGTIPGNNSPLSGDAYDCDVNNDNTYDDETERFYFIRKISDKGAINGVLVHYTNFDENGQCDSSPTQLIYSFDDGKTHLPDSTVWTNTELKSFDGKVSRYMNQSDIVAACGTWSGDDGYLDSCEFLMENTRFHSNIYGRSAIWIDKINNALYRIDTRSRKVVIQDNTASSGVRPVIEIPYNTIEGFKDKTAYTISFNSNGGSTVDPIVGYENEPIGTLPTPTRTGYIFDGWYTNTNYTTEITPETLVTGTVTYVAKWSEEIVDKLQMVFYIPGTCTFNGSNASISSASDDCISTINHTTENIDYTDNTIADFAQTANKYIDTHVSLYSENNYDKDYEIGFTIVAYDYTANVNQAVFVNSKLESSAAKYPGIVFRKGNGSNFELTQTINNVKANPTIAFTNPITTNDNPIPVVIERKDGVVSYSYNGGAMTLLQDINETSDYFDFYTWFGAGGTSAARTSTTSNAQRWLIGTLSNMYIKLESGEVVKKTVTFNAHNGTCQEASREVNKGSAIGTLPVASKSGFVFDGWYTEENGGTKIDATQIINADVEFHAHYIPLMLVTFESYGGTLSISHNTIEVAQGSAIGELPTAEKTGFIFVGWFTGETTGTKIDSTQVINNDVTYHAHYAEIRYVTFNTYGGTLSINQNPLEVADGEMIETLPTAEKTGFEFDGWYTAAEPDGTKIESTQVITSNVTYHAHYLELYTVTFNALDGQVSFASKEVANGKMVGELPTATKEGAIFEGWYTDNTYETLVETTTIITQTTEFIAKWRNANYVARVNGVDYESLDAAITAVPTTGVKTVVTLLKDVTITETVTINSSRNVEFDMQSYSISGSEIKLFLNQGTLTVKNGTLTNDGNCAGGDTCNSVDNRGTLYITGGLIQSNGKSNAIANTGTIEITGGRITCAASVAAINNNTHGIITMSAGEIVTSNTNKSQAIYNDGGTLTITGTAYLESTKSTNRAAVQNNAGTVTITGGTIISKAYSAVVNNATMTIGTLDSTINITNPVLQGKRNGLEINTGKSVTVYDGVFKGVSAAINDTALISHPEGTTFDTTGTETIGNDTYNVAYLVEDGTKYTVTFNENGGSNVEDKSVTADSEVGELPTTSKANTRFLGWFTSQTGGERVYDTTIIDDDVTFYAHFTAAEIVCKKATTLHDYNSTTFGSIQSGQTLKAGDAYDCDVNGDGTYDSSTERFYYLTDDENGNAVLIYYNNVSQTNNGGPICKADGVAYPANSPANGPTTAYLELPTTTQWPNVNIYSEPRQIKNNSGVTVTSFVYTGLAARFATLDEIKAASTSSINGTTNELTGYTFLLENTSAYGDCRSNYWLETPKSDGGVFRLDGANKKLGNVSTGDSAIRPVIEVPYNSIEIDNGLVIFDTIPAAMRNYFDNISSWASGQTDSSHASYDTAMTNNLNSNNCVYFNNDNRESENPSNGVYCDQPNKYDTGVNGPVNVYTYDVETDTRSSTIASYVTSNDGKLYNMIPNQVYYWEDANDSSINGYVKPIGERRIISIDNSSSNPIHKIRNVRDLGGIAVTYEDANGQAVNGKIKYGKLYRGEKIWGGDGNTVQYFTKLGIINELDLRAKSEKASASSTEDDLSHKIVGPSPETDTYEIIHYGIDYDGYLDANNTSKNYYSLARNALKAVMQEFVNAHNNGDDDYALFFHCRIGADRTGTMAYLLEGILGASEEERYRDYELTVFFGLRERTRFYSEKLGGDSNRYIKFVHLKQAIREAGDGVHEDVLAWFLKEDGNDQNLIDADMNLIQQFRSILVEVNS